jgi:hypothetical protein
MSALRSLLITACLSVSLSAGVARADCQAFLAPYFSHGQQGWSRVGFTYVSMQGNGLAGFATSSNYAPGHGMMVVSPSGYLDSRVRSSSARTPQIFSDRMNNTCSQSSQRFSNAGADSMDLVVGPDGQVWLISNTWGVTFHIANPTCTNEVLYGFGPPIGHYSLPALYIFRFFMTGEIT